MTTPLWDDAKAIVQEIKDAMRDPKTPRGKSTEAGTHYPLLDQCEKMMVEMTTHNYQVSFRLRISFLLPLTLSIYHRSPSVLFFISNELPRLRTRQTAN